MSRIDGCCVDEAVGICRAGAMHQNFAGTWEAGFAHTRVGSTGLSLGGELRGGAGSATKLEDKPVSVVMDGDIDTDVSVFRGGSVGGGEDRGSMVVPNSVVPVSESTREPVAVVNTKKRGIWARKSLLMVDGTKGRGRVSGGNRAPWF